MRTEVPGVALPALSESLSQAGADILPVDAMDSEPVVGTVVGRTDAFVIANNGVRDRETVAEYLSFEADAVTVARPSDDSAVCRRFQAAVRESSTRNEWF